MNYLSVTYTVISTATLMTACLLMAMAYRSRTQRWQWSLTLGVAAQLVWLLAMLGSYSLSTNVTSWLLSAEVLRFAGWFAAMSWLLQRHAQWSQWPRATLGLALVFIALVLTALLVIWQFSGATWLTASLYIAMAISILVMTEQTVRNVRPHRLIKLLAVCLSLSLAADVLVYGQQLFSGSISTLAWQTRTAAAWLLAVVLLIGTLLFRDYQNHRPQLQLSRPVFFYSASVVFTLGFMALAAIGGSYVKILGGFWSGYIYTLFTLIVLLLAAALFISKELRQRFEVMASKHFFNQKYDYRQEWLTLIRRLSELDPSHRHYHQQLLSVICTAVKSNAGALWINTGPSLSFKASTMRRESLPRELSLGEPFVRTMVKHAWIFVPHTDNPSLAMYNDTLPDWVQEDSRIWIMAPLLNQMKMTGFVVLEQPIAAPNITFEDLDLLTNVCTQIASHIRLHEQEKLISEGQQMETYHRLSAFIMHDVNNVVAQLDLLHRNAERHKANPAFIDDMIKTVASSVRRMQGLMSKFNPTGKEDRRQLQVQELLRELVSECSDRDPKPELLTEEDFSIDADRQKFMLAIKNLIRNAQDATLPDGRITLSVGLSPTGAPMLSIKDTGTGMPLEFIQDHLFKPFSTTKTDTGVGIGAYLTKTYLEHIGAHVRVNSEPFQGTEFAIVFSDNGQ